MRDPYTVGFIYLTTILYYKSLRMSTSPKPAVDQMRDWVKSP